MSIKTLHLTNCWHSGSGGVSTFYRQLLSAAAMRRRRACLVVPDSEEYVEPLGEHVRIYHVRGRPLRLSPGYRLIMPQTYLLPGSPLQRILAEERPDLVECCDRYTFNYLAALLRRQWLPGCRFRPAVVGLHCERMDENMASYVSSHPAASAFCRWYLRWLHFPMFDHHIAVSDRVAAELSAVADGHDVRRGVWVRAMGADSGLFRPERRNPEYRRNLEARAGAREGAVLLLYAGRLAREKNLDLLLDTMAQLERDRPGAFHLVIAGDGPLRGALESACEQRLPGAVCFLGHIGGREALADLLANCDIFVHPNPREPFGIAPLEALASGMCLVGPDSGGITCYADSSNSWLAEPSAESFRGAIRDICDHPAEAAERRRAARETAERFDWPKVMDRYFELYEELHALVKGGRAEPQLAPAFFSTAQRGLGWVL